jgi:hypothetical protein
MNETISDVLPLPAFPIKPQQNDLFILDNNGSSKFLDNGSSTLNSGSFNLGLL